MDDSEIKKLRKSIQDLDHQLLEVVAKRQRTSLIIAKRKLEQKLPIRDLEYEEKLLAEFQNTAKTLGLDITFSNKLFEVIIKESVKTQENYFASQQKAVKVAVIGDNLSYSNNAAKEYFANKRQTFQPIYFADFEEIFDALNTEQCQLAIVPLENSFTGIISDVEQKIDTSPVKIIDAYTLDIDHCLIGLTNTKIEQISKVYSHQQALIQCQSFLEKYPNLENYPTNSTSKAIQYLLQQASPEIAVIASENAASDPALGILESAISDSENNTTRFVIIEKQ